MQSEQLKLLPWSSGLLRVTKRDHRFSRYCNQRNHTKDDSLVLARYTYPTWKRGGQVVTAILPNLEEDDFGSICRTPAEERLFGQDGYMVVICPTIQAEIGFECFYESSIELSALKADIIASERGYILDDAFNIPIIEAG